MNKEDAEEYTQSLGLIVGGSYRQVQLAKKMGVPKALGLTTEDWVNKRLGGYIRMTVEDRRKAAEELRAEGESTRSIAGVLGVDQSTVVRDLDANASHTEQFTDAVEEITDANASPEIVARGEVEIKRAAREIKTKEKADRVAAREAQIFASLEQQHPLEGDAYRLHNGDCEQVAMAEIQAGSVDCIITDPPYPAEFLECFSKLSRLAAHVLKPGGHCLVMSGQSWLPEVLARLSENLNYQWTLSYLTPGDSAQIFGRRVKTNWKPVIWLTNGKHQWEHVEDTVTSNKNDKRFHRWGQSVGGMAQLIERFTAPGQVVLDPFVGGGATAIASIETGRLFLGIDTDPGSIASTAGRLLEVKAA